MCLNELVLKSCRPFLVFRRDSDSNGETNSKHIIITYHPCNNLVSFVFISFSFVYITLKISTFLMMNLKQITECQQGHYGKDCSQKCSMNCYLEDQCNRTNGRCDNGCKPGWTGNTCDQSKTFILHQKLLYLLR